MPNSRSAAYRNTGPWLTTIVRLLQLWRHRPRALALLATAAIGMAGCGGDPAHKVDRVKVSPAKGTISVAGQQPKGTQLVFHPADGSKPAFPLPRAKAGEDGSFTVGTYDVSDGAPPGEYKVTVQLYVAKQVDGEWVNGPNVVPQAYTTPQTTPLKFTVSEGENQPQKLEVAQ